MESFELLLVGFKVLMTWKILTLMLVGLTLGVFVGVLPGLGGPNGVAILLPLTFSMDPTSAIVMLSCIYWGALFGGAITSIRPESSAGNSASKGASTNSTSKPASSASWNCARAEFIDCSAVSAE